MIWIRASQLGALFQQCVKGWLGNRLYFSCSVTLVPFKVSFKSIHHKYPLQCPASLESSCHRCSCLRETRYLVTRARIYQMTKTPGCYPCHTNIHCSVLPVQNLHVHRTTVYSTGCFCSIGLCVLLPSIANFLICLKVTLSVSIYTNL